MNTKIQKRKPNFSPVVLICASCVYYASLTACGGRPAGTDGTENTQAFSIYLAANSALNAYDYDQDDIDALELQGEPLLTTEDIQSYCWQDHSFTLTDDTAVVFPSPGVYGLPFVVVSDQERQYLGGFWTMLSSVAYFEPALYVDAMTERSSKKHVIEWGYPSGAAEEGKDPREKSTMKEALQMAGKLIDVCLPLPHSMKGYELYSWKPTGDDWHFTLITGTNRNKSCEEVTTGESFIKEGWVKVTSSGVEAIKTVLARLPAGEWVFWTHLNFIPDCNLAIPETNIVSDVQGHCSSLGLKLALVAAHK